MHKCFVGYIIHRHSSSSLKEMLVVSVDSTLEESDQHNIFSNATENGFVLTRLLL